MNQFKTKTMQPATKIYFEHNNILLGGIVNRMMLKKNPLSWRPVDLSKNRLSSVLALVVTKTGCFDLLAGKLQAFAVLLLIALLTVLFGFLKIARQ